MPLISNLEYKIEIRITTTEVGVVVIENIHDLREFICDLYRKTVEEAQMIVNSNKELVRINKFITGPIDTCFLLIRNMDEFDILKDLHNQIYGTSLIKMFIETYGNYGDINIQIKFID